MNRPWSACHDKDLDSMSFLEWLQYNSQLWREHSFPHEHRTAPLQALGVAEEAGELCHAVLKMEQGIRGDKQLHLAEAEDAIGDIIIYLCGLATNLGINVEGATRRAWIGVAQRDWSAHKEDGIGDTHVVAEAGGVSLVQEPPLSREQQFKQVLEAEIEAAKHDEREAELRQIHAPHYGKPTAEEDEAMAKARRGLQNQAIDPYPHPKEDY